MRKGDVTCPECGAGFRRLELSSAAGSKGEYRCPACNVLLETFDGGRFVAYRLTIEPSIRLLKPSAL
jgi:transposase-like protein